MNELAERAGARSAQRGIQMKDAYVLVDHHGDSGTVRAGAILRGLSDHRFEALKRRHLVREATADEMKGGKGAAKAARAPENKAAAKPSNKATDDGKAD